MAALFANSPETMALAGGELRLWPQFLAAAAAAQLQAVLTAEVAWTQSRLFISGQHRPIPRLNAWYGDSGADYAYSGAKMHRHAWLPALLAIKARIESATAAGFNSALLNLYRDGRDSVDWHSDDEPELGPNPVIAALSLGAERELEFRPKQGDQRAPQRRRLLLPAGSLLVMGGELQTHWQHRVAKVAGLEHPRISITFRRVAGVAIPRCGC
ncbi:MAG: alpha-ketoglutarate-dependent dioxygenase AlkB family protein [Porticoccaceae bacterium]